MHSSRTDDLLGILAGKLTDADVAARHGVSAEEVREWRAMLADGLALRGRQSRVNVRRWAVVLAASLSLVTARYAWGATCAQTLPAPLKTFCVDDPALAADVNGNFNQLVLWLRQKVGNEGTPNVAITGTLDVTGPATEASTLSFGAANRQMINTYNTDFGVGVQNSTEYFRSGNAFAWFRGGSHNDAQFNAGANGAVAMKLDGASNLTVGGAITATGQLGGASLRQNACNWHETGLTDAADNQMHQVQCNSGEYMVGWRCYATGALDGRCAVLCCSP